MRKKIFFILRIFVGGAIIFALLRFISYDDLIVAYKGARKAPIIYGFLVISITCIVASLRWRFILNSLGIKITVREAIYVSLSATFFNIFLPSLLASDVFRGIALMSRFKNSNKVVSSLVIDRVSGGVAITILVAFFSLIGRHLLPERELWWIIGIVVLLGIVIMFAIFNKSIFLIMEKMAWFNPAVKGWLERFHQEFRYIRQQPSIFFKTLFYFSFPVQVLNILSFICLAKAFALSLNPLYFFIFIPIVAIIVCLPISIAGIGTRELAMVYFFSKVGVSQPVSLGISLLSFAFLGIVGLLGGIIYVVVYHRWLERST